MYIHVVVANGNVFLLPHVANEDFHDVYREVVCLTADYYKFGIGLGLPPEELNKIQTTFPRHVDHAFIEVLLVWLKQCYKVEKHGHPTWRRLVEAVDSPAGGNNHALAGEIARRHPIAGKIHSMHGISVVEMHNIPYFLECTWAFISFRTLAVDLEADF